MHDWRWTLWRYKSHRKDTHGTREQYNASQGRIVKYLRSQGLDELLNIKCQRSVLASDICLFFLDECLRYMATSFGRHEDLMLVSPTCHETRFTICLGQRYCGSSSSPDRLGTAEEIGECRHILLVICQGTLTLLISMKYF